MSMVPTSMYEKAHERIQRLEKELEELRASERDQAEKHQYWHERYDKAEAELARLRGECEQLCAYVKETAGDESVLVPVSTLSKLIPLEQHQRAIMNVIQLDMLRRSEEERASLKQRLRRAEIALGELRKAVQTHLDYDNHEGLADALVAIEKKADDT